MFRQILLSRAARSLVQQSTQGSLASSTRPVLPSSFQRPVAFFGGTSYRRSDELPDDPIDLDKEQVRDIGNENVRALADEILKLNLLEVSHLTEILKKKLNIPDAALMPMGGGGGMMNPTPENDGSTEEKPAAKTEFDLKLEAFDKGQKIKVIKEIRAITELGLKEAKELVESAPVVIKKNVKKEDADALIEKLKTVGAEVVME
ncbi:hypothetical protein CYMTET_8037 [Cymbomonas tetramitiformis]|uniref:Uncharacterized protein n=1 Tax=Cymbomonas tetramitiformis TaxID=36881 RepID=A0AAE0GUC1_9CHLO|nr:hypothetical protein CYMTET_8037 [Cymbomonas tetramitiformis]